jgi:hypothetical protein
MAPRRGVAFLLKRTFQNGSDHSQFLPPLIFTFTFTFTSTCAHKLALVLNSPAIVLSECGAMDDPLFALLDDIAETARGGHNGVPSNFDEHQLLDDEPQHYVSQQVPQNFHGVDEFSQNGQRGESGYEGEDDHRQPQGELVQLTIPLW